MTDQYQDLTNELEQCDLANAELQDEIARLRAVVDAIIACWDGPNYKHQMKPLIEQARKAGGTDE